MTSPTSKAKKQKIDDSKCILYSYWRSSCSWRVRISLEWKQIAYEYKAIHLLKGGGEQFSSSYSESNPNQRVPMLEMDGHLFTQSNAILEYLEDRNPSHRSLFASNSNYDKTKIRELCALIGCDIQPVQNLSVLIKLMNYETDKEKKTERKMEWGKYWIERGFIALEAMLCKYAGKYCYGDQVTLVDAYLVPQVYNAIRFQVDMNQFPIIERIHKELEKLDEFKKAHPSQMPDAVTT